ncbi:MAG: pyridine nucleotide-disulfide oxidoreductase [Desulfobulbaceae bacterium]|nr:MAG: pyridine nucleotide-disulfide oxidoreductase [Desulfobulbaceae bacterium]
MSMKVVVVGAVAAGPKAAVRIKRVDPSAQIVLIDQDSLISYGGCGIPYYVSGDVADENDLRKTSFHMLRDEFFFEKAKGVTTMTSTRVLSIDRTNKSVLVEKLKTGEQEEISYDKLLLATGSEPIVIPIPGVELDGVFTISDLHKAIAIKERIAKGLVGKAVVIGGGAIGIEMAEALKDLWGVETSIVEFQNQLLPNLVDWEMSEILVRHLRDNDVEVFLSEGATEIISDGDGKACGVKTNNRTLDADLIILATGVKPRSSLASATGLHVSATGAVVVNERMQTSDPDIYAAGDCVEITHLVSGQKFFAPLGSLANKQGRVAGDNIAGVPSTFKGGVGSFIMKAFDMSIGSVGLTFHGAKNSGYDADISLTSPIDRAHFFPTQAIACFLLIFDRRTRRVLGMQGVGPMGDGILARINGAAPLLGEGATIEEFANIELAYAPPFSAAIDSVNAAAYVAENLCDDRLRKINMPEYLKFIDDLDTEPDWVMLDVRHEKQAQPFIDKFGPQRWLSLPYEQVRDRYQELPQDKTLIIICNAGSRSYEIQRFLDHVGYENSLVLAGGINVIKRMNVDWLPE